MFPDFDPSSKIAEAFCGNLTGTSSVVEFGPLSRQLTFEFIRNSDEMFYNVTVRQIDCSPQRDLQKLSDTPLDEYDKNAEPKVDQFRDQIYKNFFHVR